MKLFKLVAENPEGELQYVLQVAKNAKEAGKALSNKEWKVKVAEDITDDWLKEYEELVDSILQFCDEQDVPEESGIMISYVLFDSLHNMWKGGSNRK